MYETHPVVHVIVAAAGFVLALCVGLWILAAVHGNTELQKQQNEIDGKGYVACVATHTPVECRVGEYGSR